MHLFTSESHRLLSDSHRLTYRMGLSAHKYHYRKYRLSPNVMTHFHIAYLSLHHMIKNQYHILAYQYFGSLYFHVLQISISIKLSRFTVTEMIIEYIKSHNSHITFFYFSNILINNFKKILTSNVMFSK